LLPKTKDLGSELDYPTRVKEADHSLNLKHPSSCVKWTHQWPFSDQTLMSRP